MPVELSEKDQHILGGNYGPAAQLAMRIIVRMADVLEAKTLIDIYQAHIDGCALTTDASLEFAEKLAGLGGKVVVPTTMNMIPLDLRNWQKQGVPEAFGQRGLRLAKAYLDMGCIPTWTCAPYQVFPVPQFGQPVAWGESNAINYANSVLGARTERYADFFDICAALTGRAPQYGLYLTENRKGQILFKLVGFQPEDFQSDTFFPALGHLIGKIAQERVPVIAGVPGRWNSDQFKAFGAAAAASGAVGLYHIAGMTPEAHTLADAFQGGQPEQVVEVTPASLQAARQELSTTAQTALPLDAILLGCPHFSFEEFRRLAQSIQACGGVLHPHTRLIVVTNQVSYALLERSPYLETILGFGAEIVFDTCVLYSPVERMGARVVMTNSGKCAYYAPGTLNAEIIFGSLEDCVRSAVAGAVIRGDL